MTLAPTVRRLAETMDAHEIEAMVTLVDRLPQLVTHLDEDVLPVLQTMGDVGTDVHDLLDTVQDLRQVVKGFPGSKLFRRRGAEEIAQEEAEGDRRRAPEPSRRRPPDLTHVSVGYPSARTTSPTRS